MPGGPVAGRLFRLGGGSLEEAATQSFLTLPLSAQKPFAVAATTICLGISGPLRAQEWVCSIQRVSAACLIDATREEPIPLSHRPWTRWSNHLLECSNTTYRRINLFRDQIRAILMPDCNPLVGRPTMNVGVQRSWEDMFGDLT